MVATVPGVAAGFGALRDHEVAAGLDRGDRVAHLAAHARDEHVAVVQSFDDVARDAEPGDEQRRAAGHDLCASASMRSGSAASRSTPNGLSVAASTATISSIELLGLHGRRHRACRSRPRPIPRRPARWYETPPIPASITGCSMPSISVSRVLMRPSLQAVPTASITVDFGPLDNHGRIRHGAAAAPRRAPRLLHWSASSWAATPTCR